MCSSVNILCSYISKVEPENMIENQFLSALAIKTESDWNLLMSIESQFSIAVDIIYMPLNVNYSVALQHYDIFYEEKGNAT